MKTTQSPAAENEVTPDPGPVSAKFWLLLQIRNKNAGSCRSRLRHSKSAANPFDIFKLL